MKSHRLFCQNIKLLQMMLVGCLLAGLAMSAVAQEQLNIAFVDGNEIMQRYQQEITENLQQEQEFVGQQETLGSTQEELEAMVENFRRDEAILSPDERLQRQQDIESKQLQLQQQIASYQEEFNERGNDDMLGLQAQLQEIVANIAAEEGYDIVLERITAIHYDSQYDITDAVMSALEQAQR